MHSSRAFTLGAITALCVLGAGCGGGGSTTFTTEDLPGIVLKPSEAPDDLIYWRQQSGPNMLEKEGKGSAQGLKVLHRLGLEGDYGSQFVPRSRSAAVQYAESFGLAMEDPDAASGALAIFKKRQGQMGKGVTSISAAGLGEESWGLRGSFFPGAPPTYFYSWRIGNAMFALALAGKPGAVTEQDARALADRMNERAQD
jgi:hypothetical protein